MQEVTVETTVFGQELLLERARWQAEKKQLEEKLKATGASLRWDCHAMVQNDMSWSIYMVPPLSCFQATPEEAKRASLSPQETGWKNHFVLQKKVTKA